MNLAALLQLAGSVLIVIAAAFVSPILAVFLAGVFALAFGIWEEVGD
jgi:hypothetical protein